MYTLYIGNKNQAKKKEEPQSNPRSNAQRAEQKERGKKEKAFFHFPPAFMEKRKRRASFGR